MNHIKLELEEENAAALADLLERLSEFNSEQGPHFLPDLNFAIKVCVEKGYLKFKDAFDMFGMISQVTSQIALRSEKIWRIRQAIDAALE